MLRDRKGPDPCTRHADELGVHAPEGGRNLQEEKTPEESGVFVCARCWDRTVTPSVSWKLSACWWLQFWASDQAPTTSPSSSTHLPGVWHCPRERRPHGAVSRARVPRDRVIPERLAHERALRCGHVQWLTHAHHYLRRLGARDHRLRVDPVPRRPPRRHRSIEDPHPVAQQRTALT